MTEHRRRVADPLMTQTRSPGRRHRRHQVRRRRSSTPTATCWSSTGWPPRAAPTRTWCSRALTGAIDGALARRRADAVGRIQRAGPAIGVGTAAPLDLTAGTVSPVNIPAWRLFPLRDRLSERYGRAGRDDRRRGRGGRRRALEGRSASAGDNVLGMVVSTGVGGGLVLGGRALVGSDRQRRAHRSHQSVDPVGPLCVCGGIGCLEAISSGLSIATWAAAARFHRR